MTTARERVTPLPAAYAAAHEGAIVASRQELGRLRIAGATRLDLLNRMSTQKVDTLSPGQGTATVLTTDIGRMVDRLIVYADESALRVLTGAGNAVAVAQYLLRYVFWGDDFRPEDIGPETSLLGVYGAQAGARLADAGLKAADLPLHHWRSASLDAVDVAVHRADPLAGDGYLIMGPAEAEAELWDGLIERGLTPAGADALDYLRLESGQPAFGAEISGDYIPLEANLWPDVSFNKGCYIGQEVIARLESRGRLAKRLARLKLERPVAAGTPLSRAQKNAGLITSCADGPAGVLALGYLRLSVVDADGPLLAGDVPVVAYELL